MRNLVLTLAYRGTNYHGFQVQKNAVTVCQVVQDAIQKVFGSRLDVKGCSRTDAGVHANGFVLSFYSDRVIPCAKVPEALNIHLPSDVAVQDCWEAPIAFHPRYHCIAKRYLYKIHNSRLRNPFLENLALLVRYPIKEEQMNRAAQALVGRHDFSAFCAAGGSVEDKERIIYHCEVFRDGDVVTLSITGDGFLYHMVRIIMGTLLEVAAGRLREEDLVEILLSRNRKLAGPTAPPWGLYLDRVFYDKGFLSAQI